MLELIIRARCRSSKLWLVSCISPGVEAPTGMHDPPPCKKSTGAVVMPELVESDSFEIHSFLSNIKSRDNHTIPILDEVATKTKTIIIMQDELVLRDVLNSVSKPVAMILHAGS